MTNCTVSFLESFNYQDKSLHRWDAFSVDVGNCSLTKMKALTEAVRCDWEIRKKRVRGPRVKGDYSDVIRVILAGLKGKQIWIETLRHAIPGVSENSEKPTECTTLPPVLWSPGCKENDSLVLEKRKMLQLSAISSIENLPDGDTSGGGGGGVLQMSLRKRRTLAWQHNVFLWKSSFFPLCPTRLRNQWNASI